MVLVKEIIIGFVLIGCLVGDPVSRVNVVTTGIMGEVIVHVADLVAAANGVVVEGR